MQIITDFYFQKATYLIRDKYGNELVLKNNYEDKEFKIIRKLIKNKSFKKLERKNGVNFAYKFI